MKHGRALVLTAGMIDGLAEAVAAALPRRMARYLGLSPQPVQLAPGGMSMVGLAGHGPLTLLLDSQDVYTVDLPIPRGIGIDPWKQAAMLAHRYMPLKPELLAWDLVTVREGNDVIARISMVRRSVLAAALRAGGRVASVTTAGPGPRPQFLRLDVMRLRRRLGRMLALLSVAAVVLPLPPLLVAWTLDQQTAHMEQKLKTLADEVKAVRQLQERAEVLGAVLSRDSDALVQPSRRQLLDEVARALPDDAWLQELSLHGGEIVLQVRAADPQAVLTRFQEVPLFSRARFLAPPGPNGAAFGLVLPISGDSSAAGTRGEAR
ncbi:PilN domain-containing protein [Nitrospirillum sp. BR 11163]|uniref:PilN domain-containing protein n=1 Tax=Nitrospirillum sp. BR 11163 TaxID=3104323 RepID=UPI002B002767|nr:PilN domain-containing protein [Nitrospirillum sp. BR 11163]MEA1674698.1 PilN domain-containing protein [Nitrospirillum sp. BR 11163]